MSGPIRIIEVGPRDGLQNEKIPIPTDLKLTFIRSLAAAGLNEIEVTSFVSPKWVPQLADASELWTALPAGPKYSALVPNLKGLESALKLGVGRIALFTAASDAFTAKNINMTVQQSLDVFAEVIALFRKAVSGGWVRAYVSTAFECPFTGRIDPDTVATVGANLIRLGVDEVALGDTLGVAVPSEVAILTKVLSSVVPLDRLAYHFHDTRGTAIANVVAGIESGITTFDASAGGLGGCPYAPGAGGNLATEDLVYLLERMGYRTGIDLTGLASSSLPILSLLGRAPSAKVQVATLASAARG